MSIRWRRSWSPTLEEIPKNATHWSRKSMAEHSGLSKSTVGRIWQVITALHRRHQAVEFKKFLIRIDKEVPAHLQVHLIVDNYGTHKTPAIKAWLAKHPRFEMHFTPTGSSWINQVERWFGYLAHQMIRRGAHKNIQTLEAVVSRVVV